MQKNKTTLAVFKPKALPVPAVVPKPSKTDIINAALARAKQKFDERSEALRLQFEDIDSRIKAECLAELSKNLSAYDAKLGPLYSSFASATIEFDVDSPAIKKLLKERGKIETLGWFDANHERAKIREALDGAQDRVALILSKEENVKLLDELLLKINAKKD